MAQDQKNTLKTPQSTKPLTVTLPPQFPNLPKFQKPKFNTPKFNTAFRTQNRGGGGK